MGNSPLNISTTNPTFTIAGLDGDTLSTVLSLPTLIIDTDASTNAVFAGAIQDYSGPSALTKIGPGIQTLSGANTYTGATTIEGGTLFVTGSLTSDVTTQSGGTLTGAGTISGAVVINDGATFSPGNPLGTTTVGALTLNPSSNTIISVGTNKASSVKALDRASVDGPLQINVTPETQGHQDRALILSSNALSGTFSSVNQVPLLKFTLSYVGNDIYLDYIYGIDTNNLSGNTLNVANYLNSYLNYSNAYLSVAALSGNTLTQALTSISPSRNAAGNYITQQTAFSLSSLLTGHTDTLLLQDTTSPENDSTLALLASSSDDIKRPIKSKSSKNSLSFWVSGFGEYAHQKAQNQNPAFNYLSEAAISGLDYKIGNQGLIGTAIGYAHTHFTQDHNLGHGNINGYFANLYGNVLINHFYISPALWGLFNQIENTRNISFPGFSEKAKADIFSWQLLPHLEVGYDAAFSWGRIIPFSSADLALSWQRGYQEHGAPSFNAKEKAHKSSMVRSETGLKFCTSWEKPWGIFFLKEKASYVFQKPFGQKTTTTAFLGLPTTFSVTAISQNLNLGVAAIDFGFKFGKKQPSSINLGYEGEFGTQYWSHQVMLTLRKEF